VQKEAKVTRTLGANIVHILIARELLFARKIPSGVFSQDCYAKERKKPKSEVSEKAENEGQREEIARNEYELIYRREIARCHPCRSSVNLHTGRNGIR
jgi:hypothetical protein